MARGVLLFMIYTDHLDARAASLASRLDDMVRLATACLDIRSAARDATPPAPRDRHTHVE